MPIKQREGAATIHRLGKIKLGEIVETGRVKNGRPVTYPKALDHFKFPVDMDDHVRDAIESNYGLTPTILEPVIIPVEDEERFANEYYRLYGQTFGLTCKGDGEVAQRKVDIDHFRETGEPKIADGKTRKASGMNDPVWEWQEVTCPCPLLEAKDCKPILSFQFFLPYVPGLGVWQIDTSSYYSSRHIRGCIAMLRAAFGRVSGIPLRLELKEITVTPNGMTSKKVRILDLSVASEMGFRDFAETVKRIPAEGLMILPEPDDERPYDITPDANQREVASRREQFELPSARTLRDREPPENMTLAQFEKAMNIEGWTWDDVCERAGYDHSEALKQALADGQSWTPIYITCREGGPAEYYDGDAGSADTERDAMNQAALDMFMPPGRAANMEDH